MMFVSYLALISSNTLVYGWVYRVWCTSTRHKHVMIACVINTLSAGNHVNDQWVIVRYAALLHTIKSKRSDLTL